MSDNMLMIMIMYAAALTSLATGISWFSLFMWQKIKERAYL